MGLSGFTAPGAPKVIPELSQKRQKGFTLKASLSRSIFSPAPRRATVATAYLPARTPSASERLTRTYPTSARGSTPHDCHYFDQHLSELAQQFRYGFYGDLDIAIIEVSEVKDDGTCVVGMGVGNVPTYAKYAKKVVLELNEKLHHALFGLHDIYLPQDPLPQ